MIDRNFKFSAESPQYGTDFVSNQSGSKTQFSRKKIFQTFLPKKIRFRATLVTKKIGTVLWRFGRKFEISIYHSSLFYVKISILISFC
jgi:hypothetical protein